MLKETNTMWFCELVCLMLPRRFVCQIVLTNCEHSFMSYLLCQIGYEGFNVNIEHELQHHLSSQSLFLRHYQTLLICASSRGVFVIKRVSYTKQFSSLFQQISSFHIFFIPQSISSLQRRRILSIWKREPKQKMVSAKRPNQKKRGTGTGTSRLRKIDLEVDDLWDSLNKISIHV